MSNAFVLINKKNGEKRKLSLQEVKTILEDYKAGKKSDYEIRYQVEEKNNINDSDTPRKNYENIKIDPQKFINKSLAGIKKKLKTNKQKIASAVLFGSMTLTILACGHFGATHEIIIREKNPDNVYEDMLEIGNPLDIVKSNTIYSENSSMYWFNNVGIAKDILLYGDENFDYVASMVYANEIMQANKDLNWPEIWRCFNKGTFEDYLEAKGMSEQDYKTMGLTNTAKVEVAQENAETTERGRN